MTYIEFKTLWFDSFKNKALANKLELYKTHNRCEYGKYIKQLKQDTLNIITTFEKINYTKSLEQIMIQR